MKRSPEETTGSSGGAAGDETKSIGAEESTGAGDGMKNCGVNDMTGVVAGKSSDGTTGLASEAIGMLDGAR